MPQIISNQEFLKLWASQFTSQVALNALYFVLTLKIYQLTESNTLVSILILSFTLPNIFFGYLAGVYVDQLSLKKVMVLTNTLRSIVILLLIVFINSPFILFALVFLLSFITLFFVPAEGSAIPALVKEKELIAANSLFSLTLHVGLVVGFLSGGFLMQLAGEAITLVIIFTFFILSLAFNLFLPASIKAEEAEREGGMLNNFVKGIVFVFRKKMVRDSIFFLTLTTTIILVLATIGPGYVDKILKLDIRNASALVVAPAAVGMGVGSLGLSYFGNLFRERTLINIGLFSLGLTFLGLALFSSLHFGFWFQVLSLFFIFLLGLENALITIPVTTNFQQNTPEQFRGRAYGILGTFISGLAVLPVIFSGAVADKYGIRSVLITLGVLVLCFGAYRYRPKKV